MSTPPNPVPVPPVGVEIESVKQKLEEMEASISDKIPVTCYTGNDLSNLRVALSSAREIEAHIEDCIIASEDLT